MNELNPYEPPQSENEPPRHDVKPEFREIHEGATNCLWAFAIMCGVTLMGIIVTFRSVSSSDFYEAFLYGYVGGFYLQVKGLIQLRRGVNAIVSTAPFTAAIWLFCGFWPIMALFFASIMRGTDHLAGEPIDATTVCFLLLNIAYHLTLFLSFLRISKIVDNATIARFSFAAFVTLVISYGSGVFLNALITAENRQHIGLPTVAQRNHLILYIMVFVSLFVIAHACYGIALRLIQLQTRKYKLPSKQSESEQS